VQPTVTTHTEPVIEGRALVKTWGTTRALTDLTFTVGRGVTGLLGANGAGKTTLLGMVLGLHAGDAGDLRVFGLDPASAGPEVRARIGYSPEHHTLPPDIKAFDFVRHIAEVHGIPPREARARASDSLWQVGLGEERFRPLGTMSTGQRQRVKLAQALVHDPDLVLLDEPTDGLDPVQRDDMLHLIRRIGSEFGIDVVLSSHLLDEVERVCDNAVILSEGTAVASGGIAELTGDTTGIVLGLDDGMHEVADALRAAGALVTVDAHTLRVEPNQDADAEALGSLVLAVLAETGAPLRRLHAGHRSLEDLYLGLAET
jgi:ABC-2 type transport system ATP-binding protein